MLLHLKNNHIYLPDSNGIVLENGIIRFNVHTCDIDAAQYNFSVNINGDVIPFKHEFTVDKKYFKNKYLNISITAVEIETGIQIVYKADRLPITKAVILGRPCNEWYPEIINTLNSKINELEATVKNYKIIIDKNNKNIEHNKNDIKIIELAIKEINEIGEVV